MEGISSYFSGTYLFLFILRLEGRYICGTQLEWIGSMLAVYLSAIFVSGVHQVWSMNHTQHTAEDNYPLCSINHLLGQ